MDDPLDTYPITEWVGLVRSTTRSVKGVGARGLVGVCTLPRGKFSLGFPRMLGHLV